MSFLEKSRQFWLNVTDHKCAMDVYSEEKGFHNCGKPAAAVHHLIPEGWQLDHGLEPNNSVGIPLCKEHHVGRGGEEWSEDFSMHPDIGQAFKEYRDWKTQVIEAQVTLGGDISRVIPSPFEEAIRGHREMSRHNERYWASTPEMDQHLLEKMETLTLIYLAEHPNETKPHVREHQHFDPLRQNNWWNLVELPIKEE